MFIVKIYVIQMVTEENFKFYKTMPLCLREIDTNTGLCEKKSTLKRCRDKVSGTGEPINVKINYHGYLSGNEGENKKSLLPEMQNLRGKKKRLTKRAAKGNKRLTKKNKLLSESTTSESDKISIYSDSDIENFDDVTDCRATYLQFATALMNTTTTTRKGRNKCGIAAGRC
ncbi:unnamed protein product [Euphydryas editha]|uniref:Uncharacterized protein n=1 Tax=Euphydryas editha TaxID=104508 RepID=A0AAU9UQ02_EUPED|nr:unnamed protein product [Euphydryas editha]